MGGGSWWATVHRITESDTCEVTSHAHTLDSQQSGLVSVLEQITQEEKTL